MAKLVDVPERRSALIGLGEAQVMPGVTAAFEVASPHSRTAYVLRVLLDDSLGNSVRCTLRVGNRQPIVDVSGRLFSDRQINMLQFSTTPPWRCAEALTVLVRNVAVCHSLQVMPSVLVQYRPNSESDAELTWPVGPVRLLYGVAPPPEFNEPRLPPELPCSCYDDGVMPVADRNCPRHKHEGIFG
jgi:hypothetical protein